MEDFRNDRPDPAVMALRGRIGAYTLHSRYDPRETTTAARAAFLEGFLDQVDPERVLPEAERQRRAEAARKAYFARLALASAKKRIARSRSGKGTNKQTVDGQSAVCADQEAVDVGDQLVPA